MVTVFVKPRTAPSEAVKKRPQAGLAGESACPTFSRLRLAGAAVYCARLNSFAESGKAAELKRLPLAIRRPGDRLGVRE